MVYRKVGVHTIDTDSLAIGSGAARTTFVDTFVAESGSHITLVDRNGRLGGLLNDACSFVALYQPSAFYDVNSMALGSGRKHLHGLNQGLYQLASGAKVNAYYDRVM